MNVQICIPWRTDDGHRERLWQLCHQQWQELDLRWRLSLADSGDEPFSRGRSINEAAEGDWDVAVIADADVIVPTAEQVREAVTIASRRDCQVFGFVTKYMLSQDATERLLAGDATACDPAFAIDSSSNTMSSLFAVNRKLWEQLDGFDSRLLGWGFEDLCFAYAAETIGSPAQRIVGHIFDLWHPRPRELHEEGPTYPANESIWRQYVAARGDYLTMTKLLAGRYE